MCIDTTGLPFKDQVYHCVGNLLLPNNQAEKFLLFYFHLSEPPMVLITSDNRRSTVRPKSKKQLTGAGFIKVCNQLLYHQC